MAKSAYSRKSRLENFAVIDLRTTLEFVLANCGFGSSPSENMLTAQSILDAPELEECLHHFVVRYAHRPHSFEQIVSSVSSGSVVFFGLRSGETRLVHDSLICLLAVVTFPSPIDPDLTCVEIEGETMVMRLVKMRQVVGHQACLS